MCYCIRPLLAEKSQVRKDKINGLPNCKVFAYKFAEYLAFTRYGPGIHGENSRDHPCEVVYAFGFVGAPCFGALILVPTVQEVPEGKFDFVHSLVDLLEVR